MAKKKKEDVQNDAIPTSFYKGGKGHFARNVGELKALLDLLPDDLGLSLFNEGGLRIAVANNSTDAPSDPYAFFEELDDESDYDDEE